MAEFAGWGPKVHRRLRSGSPAAEIIKVATQLEAELIVVASGSRGLSDTILLAAPLSGCSTRPRVRCWWPAPYDAQEPVFLVASPARTPLRKPDVEHASGVWGRDREPGWLLDEMASAGRENLGPCLALGLERGFGRCRGGPGRRGSGPHLSIGGRRHRGWYGPVRHRCGAGMCAGCRRGRLAPDA